MKSKGWRLAQSYQWVIDRRPPVELTQAVYRQLQEYEQKIFGLIENNTGVLPVFTSSAVPSFSFGFPKPNNPAPLPAFNIPVLHPLSLISTLSSTPISIKPFRNWNLYQRNSTDQARLIQELPKLQRLAVKKVKGRLELI
ncbi:hypothetical protein ACSBR2_015075 [Camellia fascicularis]